MSNGSFTPGPWKTYESGKVVEVQASNGKPVVSWPGFDESSTPLKVHQANARLIAAAPELLAACEAVLHSTSLTEIGRLARAAVEKATGTTAEES